MSQFSNIDDFLKFRGSEGGGQKRLKDWKKKGLFTFWFHTACMPSRVWLHKIPELVVRTDRNTQAPLKNVWGRQHVCHEDESILKKQKFTTKPEGRREHPPKRCGVCRVTDGIRNMIIDGRIKDTQIVFRFEGSDKPEENQVIHAGGLCNFWKRDLEPEEKARLNAAGVYASKVWAENMMAGLNYVFAVCDHEDANAGVQVAIQNQLVGDKVRKLINDEIASKDDAGNPFTHPYAIQLVYNEHEKKIDDKYHARRIDKYALTPDVEKVIRGPKPDLSKFVTPFNAAALRATLEKHATIDLPWDRWFPIDVPAEEAPPPVEPPPAPKTYSTPSAPAAPAEELGDPCEDCGAPMTKTQTTCGKCGAVYAVEEPAAPAPTKAAASADPGGDPDALYDNDEIPF